MGYPIHLVIEFSGLTQWAWRFLWSDTVMLLSSDIKAQFLFSGSDIKTMVKFSKNASQVKHPRFTSQILYFLCGSLLRVNSGWRRKTDIEYHSCMKLLF